ncbi:Maf-like protein [Vibrio sp. DW001]|uniref:Maf family protein n=1 Tax=Vibrio sp. DW001 TaxID=2912315 RepID=UPI0023B0427C|nr:nucleoside triphosphate pyrophosphatase [Vibrio sp. DW001]WED27679.1 Maf-like protein [Vibrio sp. DW001]
MNKLDLILASTSPFRKSILEKIQIPFKQANPSCDETPLERETPEQLVLRLALNKAKSCKTNDHSLIIGSDQVCVINGDIIGKPHTVENAVKQLTAASGQCITFYTGLALYNTSTDSTSVKLDTFKVHFRTLNQKQIEDYVKREQPLTCAGSFMSEGLGIALFDKLEGKDPNSLIGLPLITLIDMLEKQGVFILGS